MFSASLPLTNDSKYTIRREKSASNSSRAAQGFMGAGNGMISLGWSSLCLRYDRRLESGRYKVQS